MPRLRAYRLQPRNPRNPRSPRCASSNPPRKSTSIPMSSRDASSGAVAPSRSQARPVRNVCRAIGGATATVATTGAARATPTVVSSCCIATRRDGGCRDGMTEPGGERRESVGPANPEAYSLRPADYVELHCHSAFSLLDGAALPEVLVARAAELGYPALALTDHDELG